MNKVYCRTHHLPRNGRPLDDGNWVMEADRRFARPVRCGRRDWQAASDQPWEVDCRDCLKKMTPEERRLQRMTPEERRNALQAGDEALLKLAPW